MLAAERDRLLDVIHRLRQSGPVAPSYCFLGEVRVERGGRDYCYVRLIEQRTGGKQKVKSLGRAGSEQHRHWQQAIARREAIRELEMQLQLLNDLIERQAQHQELIERVLHLGVESDYD